MASDKKIVTCANDPNFAIICAFFHKFSKPLNLGHPNIQSLQEWLENSEEVSAGLKQLHIKLLRKLRKTVHETAWETALSKFCWFYSAQDAWEIERFGYKKSSLRVKLRVLRELVESQFERNGKFRTITQTMSADELRTEPIGRDKLGHSYWVAQDPDCNLRVFQEHLDEEIWQVVATNRDELVTLINRLRGNEVVLPSLVGAIDEDSSSNSCSGTIIKPPPPEERDESQDNDTVAIINNKDDNKNIIKTDDSNEEKINEKIPNIKIKFDKIIENNDGDNFNKGNSAKVNENESDEEETDEEEAEEEDGEEEDDEEDISEGEEYDKIEESEKTEEKTNPINSKNESNKKNTPRTNDNDKKVKPLIISQSKITSISEDKSANNSITLSSSSKKRPLADLELDNRETEDLTVVKKARPTLLDAKRQKNISKYEKFKDDSEDEDDDEEEDGDDDDEEEEGEEEEDEEEEGGDEEEDTEEDEEIGEPIEEKVLIVKGSGSGKDCKSSFQDFLNQSKSQKLDEGIIDVGEAIEEDVFYVCGEGSGVECLVGNPNEESESKSPPKATFYFGQPGCLKLSPVKKKPSSINVETVKEKIEDDKQSSEHIETVNDKIKDKNDSACSKEEILNNSSLTNGENEIPIETNVKTITETNTDNHTNDKTIEYTTNVSKKSEIDKLKQKQIESTSKLQFDLKSENIEKVIDDKIENKVVESSSKFEIDERNIDNNIKAIQSTSVSLNELKETIEVSSKITSSLSPEKIKTIPEILITDNEPTDITKKSDKVEEMKLNDDDKLNSSPKNLVQQKSKLPVIVSDGISKSADETENTIENIESCIVQKSVQGKELSEENETIKEILPIENTQVKINLSYEVEKPAVLTTHVNLKETDAVVSKSINFKPEKTLEPEKLIQDAEKFVEGIEKSISNFSKPVECLGTEKITKSLKSDIFTESSAKSIQQSLCFDKNKTRADTLKPEKSIAGIAKISQVYKEIEKKSDITNSAAIVNLPSQDTKAIKIEVSKEKSVIQKITEKVTNESDVPLNIVPQSPTMSKQLPSSSILNVLKSEEVTKPQINRKRRLSPAPDHNSSHLEPSEKPRRISESSETDLNSENIDGEFVEEDNNENLGDDVGGKRARFRLKIVNTDLRKKVEAQRKIGSKDTGSSSSGEDERPRKKLSPRKQFAKTQLGETSKVLENVEDEIKSNKLNLEVRKHKTSEKLQSVSVIKSSNLITDDTKISGNKIIDNNKKVDEDLVSLITSQNSIAVPEKSVSTKICNKKISPNKLADKIEFLKQSKEKNLGNITLPTSSCTVIQQKSATANKEILSLIKQEPTTIHKRISPKKIEDKIEIIKQNIEKTVNLSSTQNTENIEVQDLGRTRKRSSPPKKIDEISKNINSSKLSTPNTISDIPDELHSSTLHHESKGGESDEEIPRKRTISEESSDIKAIIVNLNENKKKSFEGHSSTDEDRSRKRTICENQSSEQINQQPAEKSSKTEKSNDVQPEILEFNTKKREAARKIAEDKLKIALRTSEDDDRAKKRGGTDQCEIKRSEKFSKIEKPISISASTSSSQKIVPIANIPQEQIMPEDLSRKNSAQFPLNKKKILAVQAATEERVKMKFPQKDYIETSDKKLKLSSIVPASPDKVTDIQKIIVPQKSEIQEPDEVQKPDSEEIRNTKVISSSVSNSIESEEERPRKRTINNDKTPPQDRPLSEIKKDKIEEPQMMKSIVSPPEKLKIIDRNEEKIKIVVKTCSIPDSTPSLPILFERLVSDRVSPEISKPIAISMIKATPKKHTDTSKKSCQPSVKKSHLKLIEAPAINAVKKETDSPLAVKTRHTRRAGDTEPLLELTLAQTKRKSRQIISNTPQKLTPTTASSICHPTGKKPKKDDTDEKLEFVECKVEPKEEIVDEHNSDDNELDENPLGKVIERSKKIIEKSTNNSKKLTVITTPKDTQAKTGGRQQRRKREIDTSNIIDTESDATPMRQSRRIAQLKIREEAERRKLEEIALKKMKEELKRKKKEEKKQLTDDPTVVTEPSESESEYKDESDVELKKKFDKKKKGKKSGWSSGSNEEDDHDADDDDLFKYPASDHGSPLFKSDHEFSPESDIEDESQVVPLKRARTARKEGETVDQRTGLAERDIDESCKKCGKSDHPEWILLCDKCDKGYHCSCLSPVLFIIPEGDWFCPPCQQEQLITALEQHLKEFDNLILSKKLEEEERIKTLELEAAEIEKQKERDALEAAENELDNKSGHKKKSSEGNGKRRKTTDNTGNNNSKDSENGTESSDVSSDEESNSRNKRSERRNQRKKDRKNKNINRKKEGREGSSKNSASSSSSNENNNSKSSATDSDDEPIYKLRKRRQANVSYRFNDYDELINRAIKKDENQGIIYSDDAGEDEEGAGNLGRGKDISTIIEADKEEKARQKLKEDEEKAIKIEKAENTKKRADEDSGSDFEPLKVKQKILTSKKQRRKKNRKLNCLDVSSEDDGSDEDFRTSSEDDDDDESFSVSSGSDSSLEMYRRRSKKGKNSRKTSRRAARERKKIRDFVVDGSDEETEEEKPKRKKKRKQVESDFTESDLDDDEDELSEDLDSDEICDDDSTDSEQSGWRPSKRKKQKTASSQKKNPSGKSVTTANTINSGKSPRQSIGKEMPKIAAAKKKPKRIDEDEKSFKASGIVKKNLQRISDTGSSSSSSDGAGGRKTRGRRLFYMDDYDDEESSDGGIKPGVKRPDTPPEEREKFIKKQEEIKRMLAEKNVNKETKDGAAKLAPSTIVSQSTKGSEKTGAGDSLSAVPLSVIRAAKALDVDYLQRKGEIDEEQSEDDDEAAAASAFGDELPDDFNPDDMDEEAIAKMMEEEDFAQHQQMKVLPSPGDVLKQQNKKLITPPKVPPQPPIHQHTSVIQDPMMRKRLPMPTFHPLMRPSHPSSGLSHLPLLQSALTNPVGMSQPPQQLTPGVPMSHHRPPQQHPIIQPTQIQVPPPTSKPRGRRKKITPLRDPVEKAAAVAAATTTSTPTTTHPNAISQNPSFPTNLSGKEAPPAGGVSSLPTSAIQPPIPTANLNVAQPPQLYKPPSNSPQPSVITRMPQMPPRQRFPDQGTRFYPPPGAAGVPPNQLLPTHHRPPPGSLRHSLMPPMHHQPPPHHTLRPSYAGGPPPLRPGGPPLRAGGPPIRAGGPPIRAGGPPLRPGGPTLRPGGPPSTLRHPTSSGSRGPPPASTTTINIGNGIGRDQPLVRQQQPVPSQFGATHRSRHPTPPLNPYRPPLYGSPGYPPAPPPQHAVGSYPPGPPYGSYYPPPSLGPATHSSTPSNSVIVAAAAAVSAAAASTVVVTPTRLAIPTSVVHHPPNQQPPPRLSSNHPNLPPPPHRPTKVTTLEPYDAKRTSPPLDLQQNQPSALLHSRENPNEDDDDDDDTTNPTTGTTSASGASEFSGLVSYFSSQHDEF